MFLKSTEIAFRRHFYTLHNVFKINLNKKIIILQLVNKTNEDNCLKLSRIHTLPLANTGSSANILADTLYPSNTLSTQCIITQTK